MKMTKIDPTPEMLIAELFARVDIAANEHGKSNAPGAAFFVKAKWNAFQRANENVARALAEQRIAGNEAMAALEEFCKLIDDLKIIDKRIRKSIKAST